MRTKNQQEASARYKRKLGNIMKLETSRDQLTKKELQLMVDENLREAKACGLNIIVEHDKTTDLYTVTIKNEGKTQCSLRRLPSLINGLRVMGAKVRALYFDHQAKLRLKTK